MELWNHFLKSNWKVGPKVDFIEKFDLVHDQFDLWPESWKKLNSDCKYKPESRPLLQAARPGRASTPALQPLLTTYGCFSQRAIISATASASRASVFSFHFLYLHVPVRQEWPGSFPWPSVTTPPPGFHRHICMFSKTLSNAHHHLPRKFPKSTLYFIKRYYIWFDLSSPSILNPSLGQGLGFVLPFQKCKEEKHSFSGFQICTLELCGFTWDP